MYMPYPRLQNLLAAVIAGIVLSVTAWSLSAREPAVFHVPVHAPSPKASPPTSEVTPEPAAQKPSTLTEQKIQRGDLSKHPARFYVKEPQ